MKTLLTSFWVLFAFIASGLAQIGAPAGLYQPGQGGGGGGGGGSLNGTNATFNFAVATNSTRTTNVAAGTLVYMTNAFTFVTQTNFPGTNAGLAIATNSVAGNFGIGFNFTWESLTAGGYEFFVTTNGVQVTNLFAYATNATVALAQSVSAYGVVNLPVTNVAIALQYRALQANSDLRIRSGQFYAQFLNGGGGAGTSTSTVKENGVNRSTVATALDFQNGTNTVARVVDTSGTEGIQVSLSPIIQGDITSSNATMKVTNTTATAYTSRGGTNIDFGNSTDAAYPLMFQYRGTNKLAIEAVTGNLIPGDPLVSLGTGSKLFSGIYGSNFVSFTTATLSYVTPSSLLRVDGTKVIQPVTIGTGLSFDGTTLTGTGGAGTVPNRTLAPMAANAITVTVGNSQEQALFYGTNNDFTITFTGVPLTAGERLTLLISNVAPAANITATFNGITPFDFDTKTTVTSLLIPSNSLYSIRMEYTTNRSIGWMVLGKDAFSWGLSNGTFTTVTTNGAGKVIAYDLASTSGSGTSVVLTNGAKINAPTITGQVTVDATTLIGSGSVGVPSVAASNVVIFGTGTGLGQPALSLQQNTTFETWSYYLTPLTATTNIDLNVSPIKTFAGAMSQNLTCNITNIGIAGGRSFVITFQGAATTTNTVKFGIVPVSAGTNLTWYSATNGSYDFQVLPNQWVIVNGTVTSQTNVNLAWTTSARLPISVQAGTSGSNAMVGGTCYVNATPLVGAGTAATNLMFWTLPAFMLTNVNDQVDFEFAGRMSFNQTTANQLQVVYGAKTVLDSGSQAATNTSFVISGTIVNRGPQSQFVKTVLDWGGGAYLTTNFTTQATENNWATSLLKLVGTSAGTSTITNEYMRVIYRPGI